MLRRSLCLVALLYPLLVSAQEPASPKRALTESKAHKMEIDDDETYSPKLDHPAYVSDGPVVWLDEAHGNPHFDKAFAKLMSADGYTVNVSRTPLKYDELSKARVLVIMNPGLFMPLKWHENPEPLFSDVESAAVRDWIAAGGSLLFASGSSKAESSQMLLNRLGVEFSTDIVTDRELTKFSSSNSVQPPYAPFAFSRDKKMFATHSIMIGRSESERVDVVAMESGTAILKFPKDAAVLVHYSDQALLVPLDWLLKKQMTQAERELHEDKGGTESKPITMQSLATPAPGLPVAVAFTLGKGRVVVLGNSTILSSVRRQFVMQEQPVDQKVGLGNGDNQKFTLNIMHWLTGLLD